MLLTPDPASSHVPTYRRRLCCRDRRVLGLQATQHLSPGAQCVRELSMAGQACPGEQGWLVGLLDPSFQTLVHNTDNTASPWPR